MANPRQRRKAKSGTTKVKSSNRQNQKLKKVIVRGKLSALFLIFHPPFQSIITQCLLVSTCNQRPTIPSSRMGRTQNCTAKLCKHGSDNEETSTLTRLWWCREGDY